MTHLLRGCCLTLLLLFSVLLQGCADACLRQDVGCLGPLMVHVDQSVVPAEGHVEIEGNGTPYTCPGPRCSPHFESSEENPRLAFSINERPEELVVRIFDADGAQTEEWTVRPEYEIDRDPSCPGRCPNHADVFLPPAATADALLESPMPE